VGVEVEASDPAAEERLLAHLVRGGSIKELCASFGHGAGPARPGVDLNAERQAAQGWRGSRSLLPVAALVPRHATSGSRRRRPMSRKEGPMR